MIAPTLLAAGMDICTGVSRSLLLLSPEGTQKVSAPALHATADNRAGGNIPGRELRGNRWEYSASPPDRRVGRAVVAEFAVKIPSAFHAAARERAAVACTTRHRCCGHWRALHTGNQVGDIAAIAQLPTELLPQQCTLLLAIAQHKVPPADTSVAPLVQAGPERGDDYRSDYCCRVDHSRCSPSTSRHH